MTRHNETDLRRRERKTHHQKESIDMTRVCHRYETSHTYTHTTSERHTIRNRQASSFVCQKEKTKILKKVSTMANSYSQFHRKLKFQNLYPIQHAYRISGLGFRV